MNAPQRTSGTAAAQVFVGGNTYAKAQSPITFPSEIAAVIDENRVNVDRNFQDYLERNRSFLHRIFPTKMDRLLCDAEMRRAQTDCDRHLRMLELAYATKYEACEEQANAWLQTQKVETRTRVAGHLAANLITLAQEIETHRQGYATHISQRYDNLERFSIHPNLRLAMEDSINQDIAKTINWLDSLLEGYRSIHLERVLTPQHSAH